MKNKKGFVLSILFVFFILGVSLPLFMINHKNVKADTISDLTGTTWIIDDEPSTFPSGRDFTNIWNNETDGPYNINFTSHNTNYTSMKFISIEDEEARLYYGNSTVLTYNGSAYSWVNNTYKTIEITGGTDTTNVDLISWFETNATQQTPTPVGTEITHKYWASYLDINMTDNEIVGDNNISYKVLLNIYTDSFNDQTLTGLAFTGKLTNIDDNYSYIYSTGNNDTLYRGSTNTIDNPMLLEFTLGDYMDDDLYDLMDERGVWFDDARAYMAGTSFGSIYGFSRGVAYGEGSGIQYSNIVTSIFNGLGNVLNIQVFPNITIALLIGLPLLLGVFIIIIKILRG